MPIRITCTSCNKLLSVRDELAGKKVKCPGCGTVFVAAAAATPSTAVKAAPPKVAPPSAKDQVSAKPIAKKPAPPPRDDDEEMDERPVRGKRPAPRDDDEDEADDRPVRKGKKAAAGGSKLWLWLVLGGVLVVGGAVGAYFIFFSGPSNTGPIAKKGGPVNAGNAGQNAAAGGDIALAELVPGDAFAFVSVSGDLWNAQAMQPLRQQFGADADGQVQKNVGISPADVERVLMFTVASFADMAQKKTPHGGVPFVVVVQSNKPLDQEKVKTAIKNSDGGKGTTVEFLDAQTMAISDASLLQIYKGKRGQSKATGVLERALTQASASKGAVVAVTIPPEAAQMAGPLAQGVPPELFKVRAVLAGLELTDKLALQASLIMDDANAAQEVKKAADGLIGLAGLMLAAPPKEPELAEVFKLGQQALKDLKVTVQDKEVTIGVQADVAALMKSIGPAIAKLQGAADSQIEVNNLKQIALAWLNYHDTFNLLPPQTFRVPPLPLGTPPASVKGLSWRVAILPFIEQNELFKQFKLDEPWDSAHNKKLIPRMPKIYESPTKKAPLGMTYYQSFTGPNTVNKILVQGMRFAQIPDGTSNTIIVAEAAQPVEWTRPSDIEVKPNQPIVLGGDASGTMAAYADATVRRLPRDLDQKILRWLIDPADGNVIPNFDGGPPPFKGGKKVIQDKK